MKPTMFSDLSWTTFKERLADVKSKPYSASGLLAICSIQFLFYLCLSFPILVWNSSDANFPIPLHPNAIVQFDTGVGGAIETFSIARGLNGSPVPTSKRLAPPFFENGADPIECDDLIIKQAGDLCFQGNHGMSSFSLTKVIVVATEDTSPVGIHFGGDEDHPMTTNLGNTFAATILVCMCLSFIHAWLAYYIYTRKDILDHDTQRYYLVMYSAFQKMVVGTLVLRIILLVSGVTDGHAMAILLSIYVFENVSRMVCTMLCEMAMEKNMQQETYRNGAAVILMSRVCTYVSMTLRAVLVLVLIFQVNNWFVSVPDMTVFEDVYEEGTGVNAVFLTCFYTLSSLVLEAWSSQKGVDVAEQLVESRIRLLDSTSSYTPTLDMASFVVYVFFDTSINVISFLCVFIYLAKPRFTT